MSLSNKASHHLGLVTTGLFNSQILAEMSQFSGNGQDTILSKQLQIPYNLMQLHRENGEWRGP